MLINKFIIKVMGIAAIAAGLTPNLPTSAANWIDFNSNELFAYQVDLENETKSEHIWTAPLKATTSGVDLGYGRLSINCKDQTLELQLHDASSGWNDWRKKDIKFARQVCARTFPQTDGNFGRQNLEPTPILNSSQDNDVVVGKK